MQIAACPTVKFIKVDDIPDSIIQEEKSIESAKEDLAKKPEEIKNKILEGRVQKRLKEMVLVEQSFIRDNNITIEELVKQHISKLGENIQILRFERFNRVIIILRYYLHYLSSFEI